jgi:hypothetical protein
MPFPVFLASGSVEAISGAYFIKCKLAKSASSSYDLALAARLWEVSEKLTGLSGN